ncbi:MAG: S41 family peptidase [Clostridiales bacterium]|nr:S41 family peptidase [Clostridiales bacterium]MDY5515473.1 S41 family peptidase [Candidatus Ventricola sp.]
MKRNYVAVVLAGIMLLAMSAQAGASSVLPMFKDQENDTVTISREEYDRLMQYSKLDTLMQLVEAYYYEDADTDAMLEGAALGLMQGIGDVYSTYYTKEEMDKFNEETEGEYAGIGCQLLADPEDTTITVTRVFKNSPADEAGIRSGDKIVYVNDVYYSAYEMDEAVSVMRGTPGESVKVTVLRGLETIDFDITRKIVNINYVEYEILEGNIGYVMVFDFLGDAYEGFAQAIAAFEEAGVCGMIIDLRNNGGGLVDACVDMADLILPEGVVVSMRDKAGQTTEYRIDDKYYDVPMVVLVNGYSASASEILAGAIRDTGAGTLVGEKTFGKGVVQSVINFPDGSGMKVTTARYYTPNGECIHEIGIEPHVEVSLDEDAVTRYGINNLPHDKDAQLQKAIELLTTEAETAQAEDAA